MAVGEMVKHTGVKRNVRRIIINNWPFFKHHDVWDPMAEGGKAFVFMELKICVRSSEPHIRVCWDHAWADSSVGPAFCALRSSEQLR